MTGDPLTFNPLQIATQLVHMLSGDELDGDERLVALGLAHKLLDGLEGAEPSFGRTFWNVEEPIGDYNTCLHPGSRGLCYLRKGHKTDPGPSGGHAYITHGA